MNIMIPAWVDGSLQPVEKLEAHKLGLKHKAISVFVFYQNKILLQRRALANIIHQAYGQTPAVLIHIGMKLTQIVRAGVSLKSYT